MKQSYLLYIVPPISADERALHFRRMSAQSSRQRIDTVPVFPLTSTVVSEIGTSSVSSTASRTSSTGNSSSDEDTRKLTLLTGDDDEDELVVYSTDKNEANRTPPNVKRARPNRRKRLIVGKRRADETLIRGRAPPDNVICTPRPCPRGPLPLSSLLPAIIMSLMLDLVASNSVLMVAMLLSALTLLLLTGSGLDDGLISPPL